MSNVWCLKAYLSYKFPTTKLANPGSDHQTIEHLCYKYDWPYLSFNPVQKPLRDKRQDPIGYALGFWPKYCKSQSSISHSLA